jgi:fructose-1,6-bisphosphatase-3
MQKELFTNIEIESEIRYLNLLADKFPSIQAASTEVINLEAILDLPKGTEHFLTDIHGEFETFSHFLRNASGVVRRKIDEVFGNRIREAEKRRLATLIYYPEQKLDVLLRDEKYPEELYTIALQRLVDVARSAASKYTRSKVRKALPKDFAYIIDELLNESSAGKQEYFNGIIRTIIRIDRAKAFIIALCKFIQRMLIDRLHVIGDIFDRGPAADKVMDALMDHHSADVQWGNHDIIWMGAASGSRMLIATVLRISARYENLDTIEDAYGINLMPLATFALKHYNNDPCKDFIPRTANEEEKNSWNVQLIKQMHKAIAIVQFKLEAQAILRNPHYGMHERTLLDKIDYEKGTIEIEGIVYTLSDKQFPTIDPASPFTLTVEEEEMMDKLRLSFLNSERLQKHIGFLYTDGGMYLAFNGNLLFHGCIPMEDDATFSSFQIDGVEYKGKALVDEFDRVARRAFLNRNHATENCADLDLMWYLWCGPMSPLFGKTKMTTFERYFINNKEVQAEPRNPYYKLREQEAVVKDILTEFGLDPLTAHIVNGHTPVKVSKGENPVKANGRLYVIDGGMSIPYQKVTGIGGYTLIYNSYSIILVQHAAFESRQKAIEEDVDIISNRAVIEQRTERIRVCDTDMGNELRKQISDLHMLLTAYRKGLVKER